MSQTKNHSYKLYISDDNNDEWDRLTNREHFNAVYIFKLYVNADNNLDICGKWTEGDIISDTLDSDNEEEIEDHKYNPS